jgi:hypothetical protein
MDGDGMTVHYTQDPARGAMWARIHDRLEAEDEERRAYLDRLVRPDIERERRRKVVLEELRARKAKAQAAEAQDKGAPWPKRT